jgi:hypothetical protein
VSFESSKSLTIDALTTLFLFSLVAENEPLDTWDEDETILTPDGDDEVNIENALSFRMLSFFQNNTSPKPF